VADRPRHSSSAAVAVTAPHSPHASTTRRTP